MMRAILIDPARRIVEEIETDGELASLQELVGGLIEAVYLADGKHHCYIDEEGLFKNPQHFFLFAGGHQPLAGCGVILGTTRGGNEAACKLSVENLIEHVIFMDLAAVRRWAEARH